MGKWEDMLFFVRKRVRFFVDQYSSFRSTVRLKRRLTVRLTAGFPRRSRSESTFSMLLKEEQERKGKQRLPHRKKEEFVREGILSGKLTEHSFPSLISHQDPRTVRDTASVLQDELHDEPRYASIRPTFSVIFANYSSR
jgi:hypothetical protein